MKGSRARYLRFLSNYDHMRIVITHLGAPAMLWSPSRRSSTQRSRYPRLGPIRYFSYPELHFTQTHKSQLVMVPTCGEKAAPGGCTRTRTAACGAWRFAGVTAYRCKRACVQRLRTVKRKFRLPRGAPSGESFSVRPARGRESCPSRAEALATFSRRPGPFFALSGLS